MSEIDKGEGGILPSETLKREFATLMSLNLQIRGLVDSRNQTLNSLRQEIISRGVAPEDRFLATTLFSNMMKTHTPEEINQSIETIKGLDRELQHHSGHTIAWLDTDVETISHRFPGPDEVQTAYYFNLGILPADSQLYSYRDGYAIKPQRAARVQIFNNLDDELNWDMGLGEERGHHFFGEPELISHQVIYVSPEGKIVTVGANKPMELPLPVIGNDAVADILQANNLDNDQRINKTAELLTTTLA